MNIEYKDFERHLNNIVNIIGFQNKMHSICRQAYDDHIDCEIVFPTLADDVIELLATATGDNEDWISYWVYDLECGKKYSDGMITDKDGSIIKLKSIKDLWNLFSQSDIS